MRAKKLLGALDPEEFNGLVEAYIDRVEPDTMSFEAFDHAVRRLAQESGCTNPNRLEPCPGNSRGMHAHLQ